MIAIIIIIVRILVTIIIIVIVVIMIIIIFITLEFLLQGCEQGHQRHRRMAKSSTVLFVTPRTKPMKTSAHHDVPSGVFRCITKYVACAHSYLSKLRRCAVRDILAFLAIVVIWLKQLKPGCTDGR